MHAPSKSKRFEAVLIRIWRIVTNLLSIAILSVAVIVAVPYIKNDRVVVRPIAVPKSLSEAGLSSDVATEMLKLALLQIQRDAKSAKLTEGVYSADRDLDIDVPGLGLSLSAIRQFIRNLIGLLDIEIEGEIVCQKISCEGSNWVIRLHANNVGATDNALVQGRAVVFGQLPQQPDMVTAAVSVFGAYAPFSAAIYYMRKDLSVSERLASKLLVDENSVDRPWHLALMCVIKSKQNIDLVAKDYCDDALERGGKYLPYVHNSRATMFWRMGPENYVDALNELNIAARQDPRYAYALFNRCYLRYLMKRHRLEDILNECRRAISLEPLNGSFYYSIADVYEAAGHLNLAIESVKKAMILEPDDSQLPELRATLLRLVRAQRR